MRLRLVEGARILTPPGRPATESVMASCELCGARRRAGKNVSHSNRHTNRWFFPNIQRAMLTISGKTKRMNVCTRCLRTMQNKRMLSA